NHINIPRLRDFGFDEDQLVYVTDYLEGTTAEDWIKSKGPMPVGAVLRIASQMVSALVSASLHGVIHYAVYPGNIMLVAGETEEGEWPLIKVLNFLGVAPSLSHSSGHGHESLNPADFASPEQLHDGPLNFRSEIYSLGASLWFLLKGVPLVGGGAALQYAIGLPGPIRELLEGMLAENPADRPSDPLALQRQIQACVGQIERQDVEASKWGLPIVLGPATENESEAVPPRRSVRKSFALAAILLAIAMLTAVILAQRGHQPGAIVAANATSEPPAFKLDADTRPADAAEKRTEPETLASNPAESENKDAQASSLDSAFSGAHTSAQLDSQTLSTFGVELASNTAVPTASNLFSPDRGIPAIDTGAEQLPTLNEAPVPAPAEGPAEIEKPLVETAPPQPTPIEEENAETPKNIPAPSPQKTPEKNSKPGHTAKAGTKKSPGVAKVSRVQPLMRDLPRQYPPPMVGHIFPRPWPILDMNQSAVSPPPPAERPERRRTNRAPTKKKSPVSRTPAPPA
ncbi:MAG TPA: hypothetical protein VLO30_03705, partial [Chthoniobacterales bacterium]|nr:hypothetical protein [Chthoniobacterales bacterium]